MLQSYSMTEGITTNSSRLLRSWLLGERCVKPNLMTLHSRMSRSSTSRIPASTLNYGRSIDSLARID
jgi:hypothetical protein